MSFRPQIAPVSDRAVREQLAENTLVVAAAHDKIDAIVPVLTRYARNLTIACGVAILMNAMLITYLLLR